MTPPTPFILTCAKCSYPLLNTEPDAHCPECGTGVDKTLASKKFSGFNRRWLISIKRALILCACSCFLNMLGHLFSAAYIIDLLTNPLAQPSLPLAVLNTLALAGVLANAWVIWRLSGQEPNGLHRTSPKTTVFLLASNFLAMITNTLMLGDDIGDNITSHVMWTICIFHWAFFIIAFNGMIYLMLSLTRTAGLLRLQSAYLWLLIASIAIDLITGMSLFLASSVIYKKDLISPHLSLALLALPSLLSIIFTLFFLVVLVLLGSAVRRAIRNQDQLETLTAKP